jgi:hypothetical protein
MEAEIFCTELNRRFSDGLGRRSSIPGSSEGKIRKKLQFRPSICELVLDSVIIGVKVRGDRKQVPYYPTCELAITVDHSL